MYDVIIVGAGISGICAANMLANLDKKVLLIEKENHVGGLCYDYNDDEGVLIPKCGPHILTTDDKEIFDYLSKYTYWKNSTQNMVCKVNGVDQIPIPFNLISIEKSLINVDIDDVIIALKDAGYQINDRLTLKQMQSIDSTTIEHLTYYLVKYLKGYYKKYYKSDAMDVLECTNPIIFNYSYDCRSSRCMYQAIPAEGYSNLFNNMLKNDNITLKLETDYRKLIRVDHKTKKTYFDNQLYENKLIVTSCIDEFFDYKYGVLPYTSMTYMDENIKTNLFQDNAMIEYHDEYNFSRVIEYKHITKQDINSTTIQFEYPDKYVAGKTAPYYPIPTKRNQEIYAMYIKLASTYPNIYFTGRLCEYRHLGMAEAIFNVDYLINREFSGTSEDEHKRQTKKQG